MEIKYRDFKYVFKNIKGKIFWDESFAFHTSLKVGGAAQAFIFPKDCEDLSAIIQTLHQYQIPRMILGDGTNFLPSDENYPGVILNLAKLNEIKVIEKNNDGVFVKVGAGTSKQKLLFWSVEQGFSGLEFLSGIPGQVGGGLFMNAGTSLGSFSDVTEKVYLLNQSGMVEEKEVAEEDFSYRSQFFSQGRIIIGAMLRLHVGDKNQISTIVKKMIAERKDRQPLHFPNCGSIFKNPSGFHAGKLIEASGLKGYRLGDAMISEKHANFIVNLGNAKSKDILSLIKHIKKTVKTLQGIDLHEEVIIASSPK